MTMTTMTSGEDALAAFLADLPDDDALQARTLAHAWTSGGGDLAIGKVAVRLTASPDGTPFTAGTIHAPRGETPARLELSRVLLEKHSVDADGFTHWSDEFADLAHHGFDPSQKFPALHLGEHVSPTELARLVTGLRDLAKMAQG